MHVKVPTHHLQEESKTKSFGKRSWGRSMVRRENSVLQERGRFGGKPLEMVGCFGFFLIHMIIASSVFAGNAH